MNIYTSEDESHASLVHDHLHLFQYYPQMELPKFVGNLKSVSSRRLRKEFPEQVNKFYWKKVLWNESYFIASCGGVTVSVLKNYIENPDSPDCEQSSPGSHPDADSASTAREAPPSS